MRHAIVYQSDEVTRAVDLKLDGRVLATQTTSGNLHLESDNSSLRLYVPKDRKARVICYIAQIPERLVMHWAMADMAAVKVIGDVFKAPTDALDGLLLELGIPEVPDLQTFVDEESGGEGDETDTEDVSQISGSTYTRANSSSFARTTPSVSSFVAKTSTTAVTQSRASTPEVLSISTSLGRQIIGSAAPVNTIEEAVSQTNDYITKYKALLDRVISAGEESNFPTNFAFLQASNAVESDAPDPNSDTIFGVRSQDAIAHDMKIGAAGELYVRSHLAGGLHKKTLES